MKHIPLIALWLLVLCGVAGACPAPQIVSANLLAQYPMTACNGSTDSGSTLFDCSGNSNNGTLINAPSWSSAGLTFTKASSQYVTLPSTLAANAETVQIFADDPYANSVGTYEALLGQDSSGDEQYAQLLTTPDQVNPSPSVYTNGGFTSIANSAVGGTGLVSWVLDATADQFYVNAAVSPSYQQQFGSQGSRGGQWYLGSRTGGDLFFGGTIYYALFYSTELTAAQIATNYSAILNILAARGVTLNPPSASTANELVFVGDSQTAGTGTGGGSNSYPAQVVTNTTYTSYNLGVSGQTLGSMQYRYPFGTVATLYHPQAAAGATGNVAVLWGGTNDICIGGATPYTAYQRLAATSSALQAEGWLVIVNTMIDRCNCTYSQLTSFNTSIRAGWSTFANGLADLAANADFGIDGACSNLTYYQSDGVHPNGTGNGVIAGIVSTAINAL